MIEENLIPIFIVESLAALIGFIVLAFEIKVLSPSIKKKNNRSVVLALTGILTFTNFIYLFRALGIYLGNSNIRQFGAVLAALVATIFLVIWGSLATKINKNIRTAGIAGIILGTLFFVIGVIINLQTLIIVGVSFYGLIPIMMMILLYRYVFNKSPYVFAKKRVFLMTVSFTLLAFTEAFSVIYINNNQFVLAAVFFALEIPARLLMTVGIFLPTRVQEFLSVFIK